MASSKLGEGGFGTVYLATLRGSGEVRVAKWVKDKRKAREEVDILSRLDNEFIIRYYSN